jgi:hypothetical protein
MRFLHQLAVSFKSPKLKLRNLIYLLTGTDWRLGVYVTAYILNGCRPIDLFARSHADF